MKQHLSSAQQELYLEFLTFVHEHVEPSANRWDIDQGISREMISLCAARGYLGGTVPTEFRRSRLGLCNLPAYLMKRLGVGASHCAGRFNVHTMVTETLCKWGTDDQQKFWLPKLASGEQVAALALTEPGAGSDLQMMKTNYRREGDTFILNGVKKWITFGAAADVLLVFGKLDGEQPIACLVHKDTPGLTITHIPDMLGFKASYLAMLEFDNVQVPVENMIGRPGFAISYLAPYALEFGRISIAWASLGLLRACVETCGAHVMDRAAFGANLIDHGMISHMITDMGVDLEAATLLCLEACRAKNDTGRMPRKRS